MHIKVIHSDTTVACFLWKICT